MPDAQETDVSGVKFSIRIPVCSPVTRRDRMLEATREAEALGYDAVFVQDHIHKSFEKHRSSPPGCGSINEPGNTLEPVMFEMVTTLAYLAASTRTIELGVGVVPLPFREPIVLAKQLASLDALSDGRLIVGVGIANVTDKPEFKALGVPFLPYAERYELGYDIAFDASAQNEIYDPFGLLEPKDFAAYRSSSNNPNLDSNDDSKRPIPGETTVLADLEGPGVVSHLWITVAASEYGWPRLLRLRVYYDGSEVPSVDVPLGDDLSATDTRSRSKVDDVVGRLHRLFVVLDDDDRVPLIAEPLERRQQHPVVAGMQTDRRLIKDVQHTDQPAADLTGQANPRSPQARLRDGAVVKGRLSRRGREGGRRRGRAVVEGLLPGRRRRVARPPLRGQRRQRRTLRGRGTAGEQQGHPQQTSRHPGWRTPHANCSWALPA